MRPATPPRRRRARPYTRLTTAVLLAACGGDGNTPTESRPTLALAAAPSPLAVQQGQSGTATVTLTRGGGFAGMVTLAATVAGNPAGVTATFAPASTPGGTAQSTLTLATSAATPAGDHAVTVTGTGAGVNASTTVVLHVNAAPPAIGVAVSNPTVSVARGASGTTRIDLSRAGGYAGDVTLTAESLPAGVTATFAPATLTGATLSSTVTLAAGADAALGGPVNVTLRAKGAGVTDATFTLPVTVTAAPAVGLAPAATSLVVAKGANGTAASTAIAVTRPAGFAGAVDFAVNAPAGVTATVTPNPLPAGESQVTLRVTGDATAAAGDIVVTASGAGLQNTALTVPYTVTAPAVTLTQPANVAVTQGAQGASVQLPVAIARTDMTGPVTVSLVDPPAGITAAEQTIAADASAGALTVNVANSVAAGAKTLTVRVAGAGGSPADTKTVTLTVNAAPVPASYTLAVAPSPVAVTAGGAAAPTTVTINRTNFAGGVTLTASGAPAGMTVTVPGAAVTANTATVNVQAAGSVAAGDYPITLTGAAQGLANVTTSFVARVAGGNTGGGSNAVHYAYCGSETLLWVAYQSNGGAWTRATGGANGYDFTVAGRGGLAYVEQSTENGVPHYSTHVVYGTAAELNSSSGYTCDSPTPGTKTVTGTVADLVPGQAASVSLGGGFANLIGGTGSAFTLTKVADGPHDLVASRSTGGTTDKLILRRGLNPANGSALAVLDFGSAEAFAPASAQLTVGGASGSVLVGTFFFTGQLGGGSLGVRQAASPLAYYGLPADKLLAADLQALYAGTSSGTTSQFVYQFFRQVTARSVTLGPVLSAPAISDAATAPYVRKRATLAAQAEYNKRVEVTFSQDARTVVVSTTADYLGGAPATWDLTTPDLSAAAGFNTAWAIQGGAVDWSAMAHGGDVGLFNGTAPTDGTTFRLGMRSSSSAAVDLSAARVSRLLAVRSAARAARGR